MATPIPPLLPACVDGSLNGKFDPIAAVSYDPSSWEYYKGVLPSVAPGIALGALGFLGFIFFVIWMIVQFCACCCCSRREHYEPEAEAQFIKKDGGLGATPFGADGRRQHRGGGGGGGCSTFAKVLIVLLTLGTVGVCGWGMAASIEYTNDQITNFWALVDSVDSRVSNTTASLSTLSGSLRDLQASIDTIDANKAELQPILGLLGATGAALASSLDATSQASDAIGSASAALDEGVATINSYMAGTLEDINSRYYGPSMTFEDEGRFIAIAVMFSLTIVAALAAGLLSLRVGTPFWASFFVAALWFCVALLMLLGVGILQGVHAVSTDTCLYAETFAVHYAGQKVQDPQKSAFLKKAVEYYVVPGSAADANGSAISYLIEFDITPVYALLDGPLSQLAAVAATPEVTAAVGGTGSQVAVAIANITTLLGPISQSVKTLDDQASRQNVGVVYQNLKSFICCDLSTSSEDLFIAWTVAGCLGFALSLLCSARVVKCTFGRSKRLG